MWAGHDWVNFCFCLSCLHLEVETGVGLGKEPMSVHSTQSLLLGMCSEHFGGHEPKWLHLEFTIECMVGDVCAFLVCVRVVCAPINRATISSL